MTKEQFKSKKLEIAKKVLPHLVNPDKYGPIYLNVPECTVLFARDEKHIMTNWQFTKVEKTALSNVGEKLRAMGVSRVSDFMMK